MESASSEWVKVEKEKRRVPKMAVEKKKSRNNGDRVLEAGEIGLVCFHPVTDK